MSNEVRSGILYVQKASGLVKKYQKRWVALYKRSSHGVSRLEVYDSKENFDKRMKGAKKHLISLESCATITRKSLPDGKKSEYQIHLTFEDNKEQPLLAESDEDMELWYSALSSVIFGGAGLTDNVIYQQYEEGYDVVIKQNEVVTKLQLSGMYSLVVSAEDVELRDKNTNQVVTYWPLQLLRKYGRDKQEFSLEAGRRCPTGPGMFYFITDHYNAIFQDVDNKVRDLAKRGRTQSTSTIKAPGVSPTFSASNAPDSPSPFSMPPSSPFQEENPYNDPIDMRASAPVIEESIYNEPVNSKPSQKGPKKAPKPMLSPKNGKIEKPYPLPKGKGAKAATGPQKPERNQPHPAKKFGGFGKKEKRNKGATNLPPSPAPPPSQVEEVTYSEALPISGLSGAVEEAEAYGCLNFEGTKRSSNTSDENQYGSLNQDWNAGSEESEYASAESVNNRFSALSTSSGEGVYDQMLRK